MCRLFISRVISVDRAKDRITKIVEKRDENNSGDRQVARPRVLVVDDHPGVRDRVVAALSASCEIVGTAEDGPSALRAFESLHPTVIVLDFSMPGMDGIAVTKRIRERDSAVRIVLYSSYEDPDLKTAAISAGANAYLTKSRLADLVKTLL